MQLAKQSGLENINQFPILLLIQPKSHWCRLAAGVGAV